jgi:hypothetical protein
MVRVGRESLLLRFEISRSALFDVFGTFSFLFLPMYTVDTLR